MLRRTLVALNGGFLFVEVHGLLFVTQEVVLGDFTVEEGLRLLGRSPGSVLLPPRGMMHD